MDDYLFYFSETQTGHIRTRHHDDGCQNNNNSSKYARTHTKGSRLAQWKRAGLITQRSVDRNHYLLKESIEQQ